MERDRKNDGLVPDGVLLTLHMSWGMRVLPGTIANGWVTRMTECLPIAQIYVPVKRRNTLNAVLVREIAESMLDIGQQAPILVRRDGERFVLIDGLHRLEACKALGEETVLGLFASAETRNPRAVSAYEAEAEALRLKTARLRQLRTAKRVAEEPSANASAETKEKPTADGTREKPNRSRDRSFRSRIATLSQWLADRKDEGFRT
jgi:uncharacterized ParB-like nuclease family protein